MPRYYDAEPSYGGSGGGGYRGSSILDLIMARGQAQAEGARRSADIWSNTIGNLTSLANTGFGEMAKRRDDTRVQQAITAARNPYPEATHPLPTVGADGTAVATAPEPGANHFESILNSVPEALRPRVLKGFQDAEVAATAVQERRMKIAQGRVELQKAQQALEAETQKTAQDARDYGGVLATHLEPALAAPDGGLSMIGIGVQHAMAKKIPGAEKYAQLYTQANQAMEQAKASGDPAAVERVVAQVRETFGGAFKEMKVGMSPAARKALMDETPAGVAMPDNGLVDPRTGKVIAPGPGKDVNLQHVETDKGIQLLNPKTGELGPVIAKGKPTGLGGMNSLYGQVDAKALADAIERGEQPPVMTDLGRPVGAAVSSELAKRGFSLASAATDWKATQKHVSSMNSTQQLRLNQAVNALPDLLDTVDTLATQWKGGRFPVLNKANLALAKGGAYGSDVAAVATQLEAQIADVNADLAVVYMGGNSPTDHGLSLASKALRGDWDQKVLHDMVKMAKQNVTIRRNSIMNTGVAGASAGNPYAGGQGGAPPPPAAGGELRVINSPEEARGLPSGTRFRTPDGRVMQVP